MVFYGFPGLAGSLAEYMAHRGSQGRNGFHGRISNVFTRIVFPMVVSMVSCGFLAVVLWFSIVCLWFSEVFF